MNAQTQQAFNRTSMELKLDGNRRLDGKPSCPFNRTSMELKPKIKRCTVRFYPTFNRTSMELKLQHPECEKSSRTLLIEPVWN